MSERKTIRPHAPAMNRKERDLDEMTGGRLPRAELRRAAANCTYMDGNLMLGVDAVHILIDHAPLDPVMKELRRSQFDAVAERVRQNHSQEGE
jgi:hypothetical protein